MLCVDGEAPSNDIRVQAYSITQRCVVHFIYRIAHYNTHTQRWCKEKYHKVAVDVTMGITPPPSFLGLKNK